MGSLTSWRYCVLFRKQFSLNEGLFAQILTAHMAQCHDSVETTELIIVKHTLKTDSSKLENYFV